MPSPEVLFSVGFVLFALCIVVPPTEFVAAGFTIENILGSFLGSENLNFVNHHIKRTTATLLVHSLLPLVYYFFLGWTCPELQLLSLDVAVHWQLFFFLSLVPPTLVALVTYYWYRKHWQGHPIATSLSHHAPQGSSWLAVASSVNIEFRRIDKFTTGLHSRRLIVTDSWIIQTSTYSIDIAHQADVHLTLTEAQEHQLSQESLTGVQILKLKVDSVNLLVSAFDIRLNAMEYSDLKEKLQRPIRNARDVVVHASLSDRFLSAFREQVQQNEPVHKPQDMDVDTCIGCMQSVSDVKLRKLCAGMEEGKCQQCFCRPMWCLECMSKWFASRQDQTRPETWLSANSPCPTCRAVFCVLDVSPII